MSGVPHCVARKLNVFWPGVAGGELIAGLIASKNANQVSRRELARAHRYAEQASRLCRSPNVGRRYFEASRATRLTSVAASRYAHCKHADEPPIWRSLLPHGAQGQ